MFCKLLDDVCGCSRSAQSKEHKCSRCKPQGETQDFSLRFHCLTATYIPIVAYPRITAPLLAQQSLKLGSDVSASV